MQRVKVAGVDAEVFVKVGEALEDRGSIFKGAVVFPVKTPREAAAAVAWLRQRPEFAGATHRVAAYRTTERKEWRDDDGEDRAGGRLRSVLKSEKVRGAAVVVARWYGGQNLGKVRFDHFASRVRLLLAAVGHEADRPLSEAGWKLAGPARSLSDGSGATLSAALPTARDARRAAALQAALRRAGNRQQKEQERPAGTISAGQGATGTPQKERPGGSAGKRETDREEDGKDTVSGHGRSSVGGKKRKAVSDNNAEDSRSSTRDEAVIDRGEAVIDLAEDDGAKKRARSDEVVDLA